MIHQQLEPLSPEARHRVLAEARWGFTVCFNGSLPGAANRPPKRPLSSLALLRSHPRAERGLDADDGTHPERMGMPGSLGVMLGGRDSRPPPPRPAGSGR